MLLRSRHIMRNGRMLCVALDHGFTMGPEGGLLNMHDIIKACGENGASAVLVHKGFARVVPSISGMGLVVHLSGSTSLSVDPKRKILVSGIESALHHGADGVSVHVNIGSDGEAEMLRGLGRVCDLAVKFGVPVLAMMYPPMSRGGGYQNDWVTLSHIARVGQECGAGIVKIPLPKKAEELERIVKSVSIPVVVAGGDIQEPLGVLRRASDALMFGAAGVSFGRGIYRSSCPGKMIAALEKIIFHNWTAERSSTVLADETGLV